MARFVFDVTDHRYPKCLRGIVLLWVALTCSVVLADEFVYEDGSTNEWTVIDNDPSGASIDIITDPALSSDVIELAGAGRSNSYRLGGTRASNGGWDDTSRDQLMLKMRTSEAYTLYVAVQTQSGFRYLIYEPRNDDRGLIGSNYIYNGVGTATVSSDWIAIERDLAADLQAGEPGNVLLSVQGLVVRGNIRIDDVALSTGDDSTDDTNTAPVAVAGDDQTIDLGATVSLNASGSTDSDGTITGWEWRDDQNALIGNTETVTWAPTTAGAMPATLIVTDDDGATGSDTVIVTVSGPGGTSGSTVVYEDGSTNEWRVLDDDPSGATSSIVTDADLSSNVIELAGAGRTNSYRLGGTRASNGGWDDTTRDQLSLRMRTSEAYTLYVAVQTQAGFRYLIYEPRNDDRGLIGSSYIYNGVGTATVSGDWITIERNLAADLQAGEPGNILLSVQGLVVRGNIRIDDVALSTGGGSTGDTNTAPVAEAGADQAIELGATVVLNASASSDPDGGVVSWEWRDDQNTVIDTTETVAWIPTTAGELTVSLTVIDADGATGSDTVVVTVTDQGTANTAPVAEAGADQAIDLGATATLDASASTDTDGAVTGWEWRDDQNTVIGTTEAVTWTPTTAGELTVSLTVTDDDGATGSDMLIVTITDQGAANIAPVAEAGEDQNIDLSATVTLDASGSTDTDGTITTWEWRDDQNMVIGTTETVTWTPTAAGALTATLTVTDDDSATHSDTVVVTVTDNTEPADSRIFGVDRSANIGATLDVGSQNHMTGLPISRTHWIGGENAILVTELRALIPTLQAGDAVIVRDGSYELKTDVLQWPDTVSGTSLAPIFLLAETIGGVQISGNLEWHLTGQHLHVAGFSFVDTTGPVVLEGDHARFASNTFTRAESGLGVYASHVEIDNNTWSGTLGLSLWHAQPRVVCGNNCRYFRYNRIHHNTWHDIAKTKSNGLEPIMLGYGYAPLPPGYDNATYARIDHNMFSNVRGDDEVISIKSDSNTIEHNCIVDSDKGSLVIRMGSDNRLRNNEILDARNTPVRISGESNTVEHNVFETGNPLVAGITLHNSEKKDSSDVYYRYQAAKDNAITDNRFVGYFYSARDYPATGILIEASSNNLIEQNRFDGTDGMEPDVRADRHRSVAEFLRDNRIADNRANSALQAHDSICNQ